MNGAVSTRGIAGPASSGFRESREAEPAYPPRERGLRAVIAVPSGVTQCGLETMFRSLRIVDEVRTVEGADQAMAELRTRAFELLVVSVDMIADDYRALWKAVQDTDVKLLLVLRGAESEDLERAALLHADGYVVETGLTTATLEETVGRMVDGEMFLPATVVRGLLNRLRKHDEGYPSRSLLTKRENQALRLLVDGLSNKQIATRLGISEHGAKRHVANLLAKLNCPNRTLAVALAVREGLCDS